MKDRGSTSDDIPTIDRKSTCDDETMIGRESRRMMKDREPSSGMHCMLLKCMIYWGTH